ncbi:DUF4012 domain-containing protein [Patescibacteria group bacterium]|nr:DUF4012 domain-containing protein [Patescibacteria group bacterium]
MSKDINIPQIKPENIKQGKVQENDISNIPVPSGDEEENTPSISQDPNVEKKKMGKKKKILLISGSVFLVILILLIVQSLMIFASAKKLIQKGNELKEAATLQDIPLVKEKLTETKESLGSLDKSLNMLFWIKPIPFIGSYVKDASNVTKAGLLGLDAAEIALGASEPYLGILGFGNGNGQQKDSEKTTQERIDFVAKALPELTPKIGEISGKISKAEEYLVDIDPERYPVTFSGKKVRVPLSSALNIFDEVSKFVTKSEPLFEVAPYLLGLDDSREYLILFQNDTELRPTGGFLTGYAIMDVEKAKFDNVSSNDIYNLDAKYRGSVEVPDPIATYIKQPYGLSKVLRLRDMNWSPDFKKSMELFLKEAKKAGVPDVDGIIAVDTQALVNFLDVIGPIGVPGYGNFSTKIEPKCNCPQVIYDLEQYADVEGPIVWFDGKIVYQPANADNRKRIIGPLMNSILANALGQPKEKLPDLFNAAFKSLFEKHILFYLTDETAQQGVESFGIAGRIEDFTGDYLHINDANLAGRKSNLYVTQEVEQKYEVEKGKIVKTLTITYKNPEKQDGWLNVILPNWVRVYVPYQSQLIASEGLKDKAEPYDDLGKTVFAGFFELRPEGVAKVTFKYSLPFEAQKDINLLIQKQPGTKTPLYTIESGKTKDEFFLRTDEQLKIKL